MNTRLKKCLIYSAMCGSMTMGMLSPATAAPISTEFNHYYDGGDGDMDIRELAEKYSNQAGHIPLPTNRVAKFDQLAGSGFNCSNRKWLMRSHGTSEWTVASTSSLLSVVSETEMTIDLKLEATGFSNWFIGCFRDGQVETSPTYTISFEDNMTQTKHPVILVPGVFAYGEIQALGNKYFHMIEDTIALTSDYTNADVKEALLGPWHNTDDRGADLASQIVVNVIEQDPDLAFTDLEDAPRVNLMAHSHGTTTSRAAINIISRHLDSLGNGDGHPVASLTSIGGPHLGSPVADGIMHVVQNWPKTIEAGATPVFGSTWIPARGFLVEFLADLIVGKAFSGLVTVISGDRTIDDYMDGSAPPLELLEVVNDFTQRGMANFNACYPSVGLPTEGYSYYFSSGAHDSKKADDSTYRYQDMLPAEKTDGLTTITVKCPEWDMNTATNTWTRKENTSSKQVQINLTSVVDDSYGYGQDDSTRRYSGDGLGNYLPATDPKAIQYFSFTGTTETWNTSWKWYVNPLEMMDPALLLIDSLMAFADGEKGDDSFNDWWDNLWAGKNHWEISGTNGSFEPAYTHKSTDAFIPEYSTRFGDYSGAIEGWNHMDEVNGLQGFVDPWSADPKTVYIMHLNKLKARGL